MDKTEIKSKVYLLSIMAVAVTMPTSIKINLISVYVYCLVWIFSTPVVEKMERARIHKEKILAFVLLFSLHIIGLLYSSNLTAGIKNIEKNIVFVAIPVLILTGKELSRRDLRCVLLSFVSSCLLIASVNLITAYYRYSQSGSYEEFFYYNLTQTFDFHPIYLSIYLLLCVFFLFSWLKHNTRRSIKWILIAAILFSGITIVLLESKTAYAILLLFGLTFLYQVLKARIKSFKIVIAALLIILIVSGYTAVRLNDRFRSIVSMQSLSLLQEDAMTDFSKINGLTLRGLFWKFSMREFFRTENILVGLGTGDVQKFLDHIYEKHNLAITLDGKRIGYYGYDVHNQYLDTFLRLGLLGLSALLFLLFFLFRHFCRDRNDIAVWFMISIALIFITETFLGLNKGIVFFSFFSSMFLQKALKRGSYFEDINSSMTQAG